MARGRKRPAGGDGGRRQRALKREAGRPGGDGRPARSRVTSKCACCLSLAAAPPELSFPASAAPGPRRIEASPPQATAAFGRDSCSPQTPATGTSARVVFGAERGPSMAGLRPSPFRMWRAIERRKGFTARQDPRGDIAPAARTSTITSDTGRYWTRICGMAEAMARAVADDVEVTRQDHA